MLREREFLIVVQESRHIVTLRIKTHHNRFLCVDGQEFVTRVCGKTIQHLLQTGRRVRSEAQVVSIKEMGDRKVGNSCTRAWDVMEDVRDVIQV